MKSQLKFEIEYNCVFVQVHVPKLTALGVLNLSAQPFASVYMCMYIIGTDHLKSRNSTLPHLVS